jgi:predicted transposase YbfD/YdcC
VRSLADAFAVVPDPRSPLGRWHPLTSILLIAACATTCDANGMTAMWQWVDDADQQTLARLHVRVDPLSGRRRPPSERTIRRVLTRVDPQAVQQAAGAFVASKLQAAGLGKPPVREREQRRAQRAGPDRPPGRPDRVGVAFDGKTLRGARRRGGRPLGLLAGVEHGSGRVLAQHAIDTKTNEIPQLRTMVAGIDLAGLVATADAAHCQHATAEAIIAAGGDYLLVLKANQASLLQQVAPLLAGPDADWAEHRHDSTDRGHGRTEERSLRVAPATGITFPGAAQIFRTVRYTGGLDGQRTGKQVVYGITSLTAQHADPAQVAAYQRGHWGIETRTHYVRDLTFAEDHCQARTDHGPQNLAAFRNLAIDTFRAAGHVNIAHARRHHTQPDCKVS